MIMRFDTRIFVPYIIIFSLFIISAFYPEKLWGTHFLAFLSFPFKLGIILTASIIFFLPIRRWVPTLFADNRIQDSQSDFDKYFIPAAFSVFMMILFYIFQITFDNYGDAYKYREFLDTIYTELPNETIPDLVSLDFSPWLGEKTVLAIIASLSYIFQIPVQTCFNALDIICGGAFIFCWSTFILLKIKSLPWQIILHMMLLSSPFLMTFFCHTEIYAIVYLFQSLLILSLVSYFSKQKKWILWILPVLMLINIKLHGTSLLYTPAIIFCFLFEFYSKKKWFVSLFTWKGLLLSVLVPVFIVGIYLYFFILKDHIDERSLLTLTMEYDHLFLPLFSPEPPLDRYNLLSWNHILDYFNLVLFWTPVGLYLFIILVFGKFKLIDFQTPAIKLISLSFILFVSLFFMLNPLLSLPMDWDLFSLPALSFMMVICLIISKIENHHSSYKILKASISIFILTIPYIVVNANPEFLSKRLEQMAIHNYNTYYEWTARNLTYALDMLNDNDQFVERKKAFFNTYESKAIPGKDYEYARLLTEEGRYLLKDKNLPLQALEFLEKARFYYTTSERNQTLLMETYFVLEEYHKAHEISLQLIEIGYPDLQSAYIYALHCALEAKYYFVNRQIKVDH